MAPSLLTMAKDLVMANIQAGHVTPDAVSDLLQTTYTTLEGLQAMEETVALAPGTAAAIQAASVNWKSSISPHAVTCLECGATFKQLSTRHLRMHGLDGRSYRTKYGIPRTQSLSAREVLARRRQIVQRIRPWEKSPTSQPAPQRKASTSRPGRSTDGAKASQTRSRRAKAS
jgi:predicted transcriptional regulator